MSKTKCFRFLALMLALLMVIPGVAAFADEADVAAAPAEDTEENDLKGVGDLTDVLTTGHYSEYLAIYSGEPAGSAPVKIDVTNYSKEATTADGVAVYDDYEGQKNAILLPGDGAVGWTFDIPSTGLYGIKCRYFPIETENSKNSSVERTVYINGAIPYYEATFIKMSKIYVNDYVIKEDGTKTFTEDINGNQIRPTMSRAPEWRDFIFADSSGYFVDPLQFHFTKGENTLQLFAQREDVVISDLEIFPIEKTISYEDYLKKYGADKIAHIDTPIVLEGEYAIATSEATIYPTSDRTSCITSPQDPALQLLNTVGGGGTGGDKKWVTVGQWVRFQVDVPQSGFYKLALRFKQDEMEGSFVSRKLRVQLAGEEKAELPFYEANYLEFNYADDWQSSFLFTAEHNDETGKNDITELMVYFEKGTNYIELEADLGRMADIIRRVDESLQEIDAAYIKILMIAGTDPDKNRDYGFYARIPDSINTLLYQSKALYDIADDIMALTGQRGSHVATLEKVAKLLNTMGSDESKIAANLSTLKGNLGTLGTWISDSRKAPLELDFIKVCSGDATEKDLPKATPNFLYSLWFEVRMFVASFTTDYNTLGQLSTFDEVSSIEVWTTNARDQAQIIRNLVNNNFTPNYGINVNLKLVAGGSLLPSVLAGVGPDVSLGHASSDVINWAIRSALTELSDLDGWNEILGYGEDETIDWPTVFKSTGRREGAWFDTSAIIPLMLNEVFWEEDVKEEEANGEKFVHFTGTDGEKYAEKYSVWALPMTQNFYMMFYRADIFLEMGLEAPKTWEDLNDIIGVLMNNNMEVAMQTNLIGFEMLLYQMGGKLYTDGGFQINLDDNTSRSAFETLCSFFTQYKFPVSYDFSNRFRTGEIPLGLVDYTSYTQLSVYATEIQGLWEFVPLPGIMQEDGTINNTSITGSSGAIMLRGAKEDDKVDDAWTFMKWFVGSKCQSDFANELTALLGTESKYNTANVLSLSELPWTTREYNNLMQQFGDLSGIPEYPGSYIISRYLNFSFLDVVNNNTDPSDALLEYLTSINSELTRKRKEFGLAYKEVSYSN